MGNLGLQDMGGPHFWFRIALAALLMSLVVSRIQRRWVFSLINLVFIGWLAGLAGVLVALGMAGSCALASRVRRRLGAGATAGVIGTIALTAACLFIFHKRGEALLELKGVGVLKGALAALGFSYASLRTVECLRALWEGRIGVLAWDQAFRYLFPFHMLAAGPIQSWDEFAAAEMEEPSPLTDTRVLQGLERIATGAFKKFVLARIVQGLFLTDFRSEGLWLWLEIQAHYLWVFLDFSAYSDIAVGAGILIGVSTPENFRQPLAARNIIVFWERWHISLSMFIRRNLFTPALLDLMRRFSGLAPLAAGGMAYLIAFLSCGLWHGLSWRFLIWGGLHAIAMVVCSTYGSRLQRRLGRKGTTAYLERRAPRWIATAVTFEFVALSLAFIQHPVFAFLD